MTGLSMQMVFSPQRCTLERLDETLTSSRRELAERLLRRYTGIVQQGGSHHTMLVGPRGSGKSHVLTYVAKKLADLTSENGEHPNIIMLPEEERSIARPFDFVLALLRALKVPEDAIRARVRGTDPQTLMAEATAMLDETIAGRATLILAENFNEIFGALGADALPRLRAFFQEHANISMLGTTTVLWNESDRPDHPFYGFFEIVSLRELTRQEAHRYLRALAKADGDDALYRALATPMGKARVKAIYHLTGGNPRLLTMLSAFLTADGLDTLVGPFVQMADRELTPYYQQRLDRLSPTQGKVVMLLADRPAPQTVTEIAERGYLQQQVTSRALHDLMQCAFVNRHPRGRESYYELREPLLRLVLDLKISGEEPLGLIVNLLRHWYNREELESLERNAPPRAKAYFRAALEAPSEKIEAFGSIQLPLVQVSGVAEVVERQALSEVGLALSRGFDALREDRWEEALAEFDRVLAADKGTEDPDLDISVARALIGRGVVLGKLGRGEEELAAYAEVERRFGTSNRPELQEQVAWALAIRGEALGKLGRDEEELAAYSRVESRFGGSDRPELQEQVAMALINRGAALGNLGRDEEALAAYAEVERQFGASNRPELQRLVAWALINRGVALRKLGRGEEALAAYVEVESRFGASDRHELQVQVARALFSRGEVLDKLSCGEEALAAYAEVERRFGASDRHELQVQVARALLSRGVVLDKLGRGEEALAAYAEVERQFGANERPELQVQVAMALTKSGVALGKLGRGEEALAAYAEVESRFGVSDMPELQKRVVGALLGQGATLLEMWRVPEALQTLRKLLAVTKPEDEVRRIAVAGFIALLRDRPPDLKDFIRCFSDDHDSLVAGLTDWIASQMPMTQETAKRLEETEAHLAEAFAEIPTAHLPLKMLNAARRDALGDTKALLELPLELRRLIKPEPGDEDEDTEGE